MSRKGIWSLVGAGLELIGGIGTIIGLICEFTPEKKDCDNDVPQIADKTEEEQ